MPFKEIVRAVDRAVDGAVARFSGFPELLPPEREAARLARKAAGLRLTGQITPEHAAGILSSVSSEFTEIANDAYNFTKKDVCILEI